MSIHRVSLMLAASAGLAACGGGSGDDAPAALGGSTPPPPAVVLPLLSVLEQTPATPSRAGATYDPVRDSFIILPPEADFEVEIARNTDPAVPRPGGFSVYSNGVANAVRIVTSSGSGTAFAAHLGGNAAERGHARLTETPVPTPGRATFAGSYMGIITTVDSFAYRGFITGEVALRADFDAMTMEGDITRRVNTSGRDFAPLALDPSPISAEGGFGGPTSGGILTGLGYDSATGVYGGLVTGPGGGEVVGSVSVLHEDATLRPFLERGAFAAE